ncbi:MAG: efflux RND transporter periplasmic adaptor subunit, partial [Pirellulales bacterium]
LPANRSGAEGRGAPGPVQVATVRPTVEDFRHTTSQPAHVEPDEQTDIYAKASGFVAKVLVDIGDRVEKDQVFAELWNPELEQERLQSAALVEEAKAAIGQAKANLHAADAMIKAAAAEAREADATIAKYEADVNYRQSEHRRFDQLAKEKAVHESLAYEKLNQFEGAKAALVAAQAGVESAQAKFDVEKARQVQAKSNLAHAEARLKVAEAKLHHSEIMVAYTKVRAPYAAIVTQRFVDTGDFVTSPTGSKTQPLFTVARVDVLRIIADLPEAESSMVRVGQPVSLVVDALKGRTFAGRVKRTTGVLEPTAHSLRIEAELDQPQPDLRPGMFGMLTVTLADRRQATLIPTKCLRYQDGRPFVLRVVD